MMVIANRTNYRKRGWALDGYPEMTYRSHYHGWACTDYFPGGWMSCNAHNETGQTAIIWWYVPQSVMDKVRVGIEVDMEDMVTDWDKCNDIEIDIE